MTAMIKIDNLGKKYILRHQQSGRSGYHTLREAIYGAARGIGDRIRHPFGPFSSNEREEFWALKDVDLEIKQGERVGIIGRNGAGKSTLLKLLSRITEPTTGRIELNGRVASLLEVGTGFHPELSGRENIFLSGAVMGMRREEIKKKFDEIVAFAEVEKFLDTPVKRYSSGMYVRLAFAVAAHLEPEILLVDEVLAVGDAAFQKKCLGKMEDVSNNQGRTVLFVSHQLGTIKKLCSRCIFLDSGTIAGQGETDDIIKLYRESLLNYDSTDISSSLAALPSDPAIEIHNIEILQENKQSVNFSNEYPIKLVWDYTVKEEISGLRLYFDILDMDGNILVRSFNDSHESCRKPLKPGRNKSCAFIPSKLLGPAQYDIVFRATIHNTRACTGNGVEVRITVENHLAIDDNYPDNPFRAKFLPFIEWETKPV